MGRNLLKTNTNRLLIFLFWLLLGLSSIRGWYRLADLKTEEPPIWEIYSFASQLVGSWPLFAIIAAGLVIFYVLIIFNPREEHVKNILIWVTIFGLPAVLVYPIGSPDAFGYAAFSHLHAFYGLNPHQTAIANVTDYMKDPFLKNYITPTGVSPYGPLWTWLSYILYRLFAVGGLVSLLIGFKLFGLLMHLCITACVYYLANEVSKGKGPIAAVLYGFNPLAVFDLVVNAHNDGMGILLLLITLYLFVKENLFWPLTLGLAITAKITILLAVPLVYWKILKTKKFIYTLFSAGLMLAVIFMAYSSFSFGGDFLLGPKNTFGGNYDNTLPIILYNLGCVQTPLIVNITFTILFISSYAYLLKKVGVGEHNALFIGMGLSFITYFLSIATAVHQWYYIWPLTLIVLVPENPWRKLIIFQTILLFISYIVKIIYWPNFTIYGPYVYLLPLAPLLAFIILKHRYIISDIKRILT